MAIDMLTPANATIENPSFEGDFTGWTATGDAFTQIMMLFRNGLESTSIKMENTISIHGTGR